MGKLKFSALIAGALMAAQAWAAEPDAAHIKAAHDLLVSMQAEKMLRMTAGTSRYANPAQRAEVMDKVIKVQPEYVYSHLALPVARLISAETATEMTHYYESSYGKRLLQHTYNSAPSLYNTDPEPTAKEKVELNKPAFQKANAEFKKAEGAIHHEAFLLVAEINRKPAQ